MKAIWYIIKHRNIQAWHKNTVKLSDIFKHGGWGEIPLNLEPHISQWIPLLQKTSWNTNKYFSICPELLHYNALFADTLSFCSNFISQAVPQVSGYFENRVRGMVGGHPLCTHINQIKVGVSIFGAVFNHILTHCRPRSQGRFCV